MATIEERKKTKQKKRMQLRVDGRDAAARQVWTGQQQQQQKASHLSRVCVVHPPSVQCNCAAQVGDWSERACSTGILLNLKERRERHAIAPADD
jgi:hypothetical protein